MSSRNSGRYTLITIKTPIKDGLRKNRITLDSFALSQAKIVIDEADILRK